jgi:hypothetical protein
MSGKCNALLLADRVIREDNGKRGIVGSFNTFNLQTFPAPVPPFFIYANLEDFSGKHEFSINIVREGADFVILSTGGEIDFVETGKEADIVIPVSGLQFPKEGLYNVILKVGNYQYGSRRLIVNKLPEAQ